jgi:hypothetical protein
MKNPQNIQKKIEKWTKKTYLNNKKKKINSCQQSLTTRYYIYGNTMSFTGYGFFKNFISYRFFFSNIYI